MEIFKNFSKTNSDAYILAYGFCQLNNAGLNSILVTVFHSHNNINLLYIKCLSAVNEHDYS